MSKKLYILIKKHYNQVFWEKSMYSKSKMSISKQLDYTSQNNMLYHTAYPEHLWYVTFSVCGWQNYRHMKIYVYCL